MIRLGWDRHKMSYFAVFQGLLCPSFLMNEALGRNFDIFEWSNAQGEQNNSDKTFKVFFLFPPGSLFYPFKTSHSLTPSQLSSCMLMTADANEAKFDANFGEKGFERINQLKQQQSKTVGGIFHLRSKPTSLKRIRDDLRPSDRFIKLNC